MSTCIITGQRHHGGLMLYMKLDDFFQNEKVVTYPKCDNIREFTFLKIISMVRITMRNMHKISRIVRNFGLLFKCQKIISIVCELLKQQML